MNSTIVGLIIGIILVIITLVLIFWGRGNENARVDDVRRVDAEEVTRQAAFTAEKVVPAMPVGTAGMDDLTMIEGIGPKIAGILKQAGVSSFAQLAAADLPFLENLLKENGLQFTKPATWAEQARLAADGKMDELKALQEKLVAGR